MRRIRIYSKDESQYYDLPQTREVKNGGENIAKEVQTSDGGIVQYIIGYRPAFTAIWDYFPNATLTELIPLMRQGGFFRVDYPDTDGTDKSGLFKVAVSQMGIFKFIGTTPMWHGLTLAFTSQKVERGE